MRAQFGKELQFLLRSVNFPFFNLDRRAYAFFVVTLSKSFIHQNAADGFIYRLSILRGETYN